MFKRLSVEQYPLTSCSGHLTTTLAELYRCFGEPHIWSNVDYPDDSIKTTICYGLLDLVNDEPVAIWDYKNWNYNGQNVDPNEFFSFSVGCKSEDTLRRLQNTILKPTLLWLDDYRDPFTRDWLNFSPIGKDVNVIWVKNYSEFVTCLVVGGIPAGVSFDHDLADEHIQYYWNNGGKENPPNPQDAIFQEKTGYDCAKTLIDLCQATDTPLPKWYVHSANPVGKQNINCLLNNYKKYVERTED